MKLASQAQRNKQFKDVYYHKNQVQELRRQKQETLRLSELQLFSHLNKDVDLANQYIDLHGQSVASSISITDSRLKDV